MYILYICIYSTYVHIYIYILYNQKHIKNVQKPKPLHLHTLITVITLITLIHPSHARETPGSRFASSRDFPRWH